MDKIDSHEMAYVLWIYSSELGGADPVEKPLQYFLDEITKRIQEELR